METGRLYLGSIAGPLGPATPFNGFLIKHPKGLTLVDTGFGTTLGSEGPAGELVYGDLRMPWIRRTSVQALADHGIEPGDVKYIINTHVGDHSGDNHMFPEATFIIQEPEAEWVRRTAPHGPQSLKEWDFPGAKLELLGGEDVEVLPGLRCLFTPGHTPGHQSVVLEDDGVTTLFVGDAVYTEEIWGDPSAISPEHPAFMLQVNPSDPDALAVWQTSAAKLKALNADDVHFAHDASFIHAGHRH